MSLYSIDIPIEARNKLLKQVKKKRSQKIKFFIDYDKESRILYDNVYLEDIDFVVKHPLARENAIMLTNEEDLIIERFNLINQVFILSHL